MFCQPKEYVLCDFCCILFKTSIQTTIIPTVNVIITVGFEADKSGEYDITSESHVLSNSIGFVMDYSITDTVC